MAVSGLLIIGPVELFFPRAAATVFGGYVWLALALFYGLCVTLIALTSRPRLVVYGRTPDEIFGPLLDAAKTIDAGATGNADTLQIQLPSVAVRIRADGQRLVDYAEIVAFEPNVAPEIWSRLLVELRGGIARQHSVRPRRGFAMLIAALALSGIAIWQSFGNQALVVQGFKEWLWR